MCECNYITGKTQCVPLPYSDRKGYEYVIKIIEYEDCKDCDLKLSLAYEKAWCIMYRPYDEDCMCLGDYPLPDSDSAIKLSAALIFAVVAVVML